VARGAAVGSTWPPRRGHYGGELGAAWGDHRGPEDLRCVARGRRAGGKALRRQLVSDRRVGVGRGACVGGEAIARWNRYDTGESQDRPILGRTALEQLQRVLEKPLAKVDEA
jgi:hypothetical protein